MGRDVDEKFCFGKIKMPVRYPNGDVRSAIECILLMCYQNFSDIRIGNKNFRVVSYGYLP